MDLKNFENVPCMWKPLADRGNHFEKFMKLIENEYKVKIDSYWDLHKWSIENIAEFWANIWDFTGVKFSKKYDQVIDLNIPMYNAPKWFSGAELNFAENILKYKDDKIAITAVGEDREEKLITYADVFEEIKLYAAAFRKYGLKKGDKIACYMSNREEAIYAFVAAMSIGAVFVGALPMLGAKAVLDRIEQVNPRILIAVDRFRYTKQEFDMLPKLAFLSQNLPTLEKVIIIPTKPNFTEKDTSSIINSCLLKEFLDLGRNSDGSVPDIIYEQVPFSDPMIISYTSGTTGPPKALVHDNGCLISTLRDQYLHGDTSRSNVGLNVSPVGWATWNFTAWQFISGGKAILFDGDPYLLTPTYLWDIIDQYKVTSLFVTPGILDDLEKRGYVPTEKHTLKSLRALFAGASVVKPQNYDFVYNKIKPDILFASAYGSTEVLGSCMTLHRSLPIYRGEISCPSLGVDLQCLDDDGKPVLGEFGNLVLAKPIPSLTIGIFGDTDGSKFRETYFSKFTDKFAVGDLGVINPVTRGIIIYCRSDEVLQPFGCRFGSSEIYNVVNILPEIHDSVCVSQYSKNGTERAVLFLKVREGYQFNDELVKKVKHTIEKELTVEHVPSLILSVPEIPYNINNKKMEVLIKKIINNMPYNPDVVRNKQSLQYYFNVPQFEE